MIPSTQTSAGDQRQCPVCGQPVAIERFAAACDTPCPHCGCLLWMPNSPGLEWAYGFRRFAIADPAVRTKEIAIAAIIDRLVESGALEAEHRSGVVAALLKRESLGSTGIGGGVAIPHANYPGIASFIGAVTMLKVGVDFASVDSKPVHMVILSVSPADRPGEHLRVLEAVARRLRQQV
jgi:mannitol/fructose-specific phosphotransferase system IIA component (Ntr-type)